MHYRFVPTQLRDKSEIEGRLGITNFHLLLDGCRIAEAEEVWEEDGMLFKSFIKTTAMNGWSIITQELQPGADAVAFRIEGSNDMLAWDLVGAPVWRAQSRFPAMQFKYRTEPLRYSTARSAEITFDPRRTPERSLSLYTAIILSSVAAVAIVLTWLDRVRLASWVLVGCLPVISVLGFMTGVELIAERRTFQVLSALPQQLTLSRVALFPARAGCVARTVRRGHETAVCKNWTMSGAWLRLGGWTMSGAELWD